MEGTIDNLKNLIPESFKSLEYESRRNDLIRIANQKKADLIKQLNEKSAEYGFIYTANDQGIFSIPLKDNRPMNEEEYHNLTLEEREEMMKKYGELQLITYDDFNKLRELDEKLVQGIKDLDKKIAADLVHFDINRIRDRYKVNSKICSYLDELEEDILEHIDKFKKRPSDNPSIFDLTSDSDSNFFIRYMVNLFIDNGNLKHAPIVNESNQSTLT